MIFLKLTKIVRFLVFHCLPFQSLIESSFFLVFTFLFTGIFSPKGIDVPNPIQTICTRWGSDPLSYGSYSHVRVQSSGSDYDILAESLGNQLFFAGEATNRQYPASMHGAFLSGLREASRIYRATRGRQNNLRKLTQRNVGPSSDLLLDSPGALSFDWNFNNTLAILTSAVLGFLLQWSGALAIG